MSFVSNNNIPLGLAIEKGLINNFSSVGQFGYNPDVGTTFETITSVGGIYVYPTASSTALVTSSNSVSDNGGTVLISGLDQNFDLASETVTIGGSASTTTFIRVFSTRMLTANTGDANVGVITTTVDSKTVASIPVGYGSNLSCIYTVPRNKKAWIISASIGMSKQKELESKIMTKGINNGNVWNTVGYQSSFSVPVYRKFEIPILVEEKNDIEIRAKADATCSVSASFSIILEDTVQS